MEPKQFNFKAQETLEKAQKILIQYKHKELRSLHLLLAILEESDTVLHIALDEQEIDLETVILNVKYKLVTYPTSTTISKHGILLSQEMLNILEKTEKICNNSNEEMMSIEHMILAILSTNCLAKEILNSHKITTKEIEKVLNDFKESIDNKTGNVSYKIIEKYCINITDQARKNKLDPLIGRQDELNHIMQILSRRTKNNPVLLGEPGVGKTALAEGLAQQIVSNNVPNNLKNKEIVSLDIGSMIAGTKFRGEFEERLKNLIKEITQTDKYIVFIDELHTIVGAGATEGSVDASNILKPALARGDIKVLGATTYKDYKHSIEKDPALERRFQPVYIEEPTQEDALTILRGLKPKYEAFHGVKITDEALKEAIFLSTRYISDRFLPDKAIDLIDEAASHLKLQINSTPSEIAEIQKQIKTLEIEREALKKEENKKSKQRLVEIDKDLQEYKKQEKNLSSV
ncbi:MAG: ATP-dependent Clp protease ATP-binding subunit [Candidatus Pacebacteria bacterium]|nr:ATP-dependent Clp protease ATP-binding subunit [Candidatus Paceibacterota bacterium]